MKSVKWLLIISFLFALIGCGNFFTDDNTYLPDDLYSYEIDSSRKEELINLAIIGDYSVSVDTVKEELGAFIKSNSSNSSTSTRSANINDDEISIDVVDSLSYDIEKASSISRSTTIEQFDGVDFHIMTIENNSVGTKGYALTSNDRRIGTILMIIEDEEFSTEINDDPFFQIYLGNLECYIDSTAEIWNSITDTDLTQQRSTESTVTNDAYTYSNWSWTTNERCNLKTRWSQSRSPYPDAIRHYYGTYLGTTNGNKYITGCGAVAVAQIMAYKKYPQSCSSAEYSKLKNSSWSELTLNDGTLWDGKYEWDEMQTVKSAYLLNSDYEMQVAALFFDVAEGINSTYKYTGSASTSSGITNRLAFFKEKGYTYDSEQSYNFSAIKKSIDNNCPVMIRGYDEKDVETKNFLWWTYVVSVSYSGGHAWIIDGYATGSCTATNSTNNSSVIINTNFVHCEPGWGNSTRYGYYVSGVFDMSKSALLNDRSVDADMYYQHNIKIVTNIKP